MTLVQSASSFSLPMLIDGDETLYWPITFFLDADSQSKFLASVGESVH